MANSDVTSYKRQFIGQHVVTGTIGHHLFDGRYMVTHKDLNITVFDVFHTLQRTFAVELPPTTTDCKSPTTNKCTIINVSLLNINTPLVLFKQADYLVVYFGVGKIDIHCSIIVVEQTFVVSTDIKPRYLSWIPQWGTPNMHNDLVLNVAERFVGGRHFVLKKSFDGQLRVAPFDVPSTMCVIGRFDGHLYGLTRQQSNHNSNGNEPIDLVKFSLSNGEPVQKRTINWEIAKKVDFTSTATVTHNMCCVEKRLFAKSSRGKRASEIVVLDLDTMEWKSTGIRLKNIWSIASDGKRALIVQTGSTASQFDNIYRFVFDEPDKLLILAWLRLKRIFDARPDAYNYVLSQLSENFKLKSPLSI